MGIVTRRVLRAVSARLGGAPLLPHPWIVSQTWDALFLASWPLEPAALAAIVPAELPIDTIDGSAWITLVAMRTRNIHLRCLPEVPGQSEAAELNCRTYVRAGGRRGVFFLSLDGATRLMGRVGRALFRLPYHDADVAYVETSGSYQIVSHRIGGVAADFSARLRPTGAPRRAARGSLEDFLTERYSAFAVPGEGLLARTDLEHAPWWIQSATAEIEVNTVPAACGVDLPREPPILLFARTSDVRAGLPTLERAAIGGTAP